MQPAVSCGETTLRDFAVDRGRRDTWKDGRRRSGGLGLAGGTCYFFHRMPKLTVDAGREAQQNRADVEMGLKTPSDHCAELEEDIGDEIERRAAGAKPIMETARKYDVPLKMSWKPSGGSFQQPEAAKPQRG